MVLAITRRQSSSLATSWLRKIASPPLEGKLIGKLRALVAAKVGQNDTRALARKHCRRSAAKTEARARYNCRLARDPTHDALTLEHIAPTPAAGLI